MRGPRLLHVLNGDATREQLERSGIPGTLAVYADPLHEGPVPPDDDVPAWLDVRARFWGGDDGDAADRRWQAALDRFPEFDEVVLWFEHDLFDQLLLIRHLAWFARQRPGPGRLSLICIGEFPGVEPFIGLGQLSPDQLAPQLDTRAPVTERQTRLAVAAWRAFTSPDPTGLEQVLAGDTSDLPFLAATLHRFLQEYPSVRNGLPRTERQILQALEPAPLDPITLYLESRKSEESIFMGDAVCWLRVEYLTRGTHPLVEVDVERWDRGRPEGWARITEVGREVLAGRADSVRLNGIDRWLGGVHLHGEEAAWRWDEEAGRLRASASG